MFESLKFVGLSIHNAPVDIRERVSMDQEDTAQLIRHIKEFTSATEALVISTCNRTEVYYTSEEDHYGDIIKLIGVLKGIPVTKEFTGYFRTLEDHTLVVNHLFRVSMGLESKVLGDLQITNQVKNAYQTSADLEAAGPLLHRLMHTIFFTNKRVVQETAFRDGAASVSYAAVELINEVVTGIINPRILLIGLGEMGEDICRNLADSNLKDRVTIVNRSEDKAIQLAEETGVTFVRMDRMDELIRDSDVIISSVRKEEPLITEDFVKSLGILSYKFFIDISVPRSIDPSIEKVPGAILYNIDSLENKTSEALNKRLKSIPYVEAIIEEAISEFKEWSKEMEVSPTIKKLKGALEDIRQQEITRHLKSLNSEETEKVELITRNIMQKIIKLPVLQLKAACKRGEADSLIDVINDLFNLEKEEITKKQ